MKTNSWSIMEWIFAGSLPKGGPSGEATPEQGAVAGEKDLEARLGREAERLQKERQAGEEDTQLEKARRDAVLVREQLARKEADAQSREGALKRGLPPEVDKEIDKAEEQAPAAFQEKLRQGIGKTREKLSNGLGRIIRGRKELDRKALEELEELLLTSDIGPQTTGRLIKALEGRLRRDELKSPERLKSALQEEIQRVMERSYQPPNLDGKPPVVVLVAGVNGTGKTTTIGKLAAQARRRGKKVLLVAGDTFRAAAADQLAGWGERAQCEVFRQPEGSNPSGVVYQGVEKAIREGFDLVFCDTAGRLHTKTNLMEELKKIKRVIGKLTPDGPHETYLVLDANNGQNAIHQARDFHKALEVTGLIVTKLDGTARGGVLVGIVNEFEIPVRYIGVGEGVDDLRPFEPREFAASLIE